MRPIDADALFRAMEDSEWYNNADRDEIAEKLVLDAPTIEPEPHWIPCSKRLPEPNEVDDNGFTKAYLVQDARWMDVARFDGDHWIAWGYGTHLFNVTAWCELPKPYQKRR